MKLSKGFEDYLEAIYLLKESSGIVKIRDIALHLGIRLSSVTEMMKRLAKGGFVKYERYKPVALTKKGEAVAKKVSADHMLLTEFFVSLGVDRKTASKDACLAEHILSKRTLDKIKRFVGRSG